MSKNDFKIVQDFSFKRNDDEFSWIVYIKFKTRYMTRESGKINFSSKILTSIEWSNQSYKHNMNLVS